MVKRRITKKELRAEQESVAELLRDLLAAGEDADDDSYASIGFNLVYLTRAHLLLDPSWPNSRRWLDDISWYSAATVGRDSFLGLGTLWWGVRSDTAGAQVPEPFAVRMSVASPLTYSIKFGAGPGRREFDVPFRETAPSPAEVDVKARDRYGLTALVRASGDGDAPAVRLLLERGADVDARCPDGSTALIWATLFGHADVVRALLDGGAKGVNLRAPAGGETPLMIAALYGYSEITSMLLAAGAETGAADKCGRTARDNARYGLSLVAATGRPYQQVAEALAVTA